MDKAELLKIGTTESLKRALDAVVQLRGYINYYTYSSNNLSLFEDRAEALLDAVRDYRKCHQVKLPKGE